MKYKVCVYAISKNEEQFADRWLDAVSEADLVVVLDTGSTDNTVKKLRDRGALVYEQTFSPWRFDDARNAAMDFIPEDVDICVPNDLDEVFEPGWREALEQNWTPEATRAGFWFAWSHKEDGAILKKYPMEKVHRRHGFRWVHPVHEILVYSGTDPEKSIFIDEIVLHHWPELTKSRGQYLPLLELSAKENPEDDRTMFWLGREYVFSGMNEKGIETLKHHLEMPSATWPEERSASMRFIGRAYLAGGDVKEAKSWFYRAAAECPHVREPWVALAQLGYQTCDWQLAFWAAKKGLEIAKSTDSYLVDPVSWGYALYDIGSIACYYLGMMSQALSYINEACSMAPDDERMRGNRILIEGKQKEGAVV